MVRVLPSYTNSAESTPLLADHMLTESLYTDNPYASKSSCGRSTRCTRHSSLSVNHSYSDHPCNYTWHFLNIKLFSTISVLENTYRTFNAKISRSAHALKFVVYLFSVVLIQNWFVGPAARHFGCCSRAARRAGPVGHVVWA